MNQSGESDEIHFGFDLGTGDPIFSEICPPITTSSTDHATPTPSVFPPDELSSTVVCDSLRTPHSSSSLLPPHQHHPSTGQTQSASSSTYSSRATLMLTVADIPDVQTFLKRIGRDADKECEDKIRVHTLYNRADKRPGGSYSMPTVRY